MGGSLAPVDIALTSRDGKRIALELDGPQHRTSNPPYRTLGSTHQRNLLLAARGWHVCSVTLEHWNQTNHNYVPMDRRRKTLFLTRVLDKLNVAYDLDAARELMQLKHDAGQPG